MVDDNMGSVKLWYLTELFVKDPIPNTIDDYLAFIDNELEFVRLRNCRIKDYIGTHAASSAEFAL